MIMERRTANPMAIGLPVVPDRHADQVADADSELSDLLRAVASAVLAVPGVSHLQPTITTVGPRLLLHQEPTDGVRIRRCADGPHLRVDIDITVRGTQSPRLSTTQSAPPQPRWW